MTVVIINGQNHKGSTYHTARMIADKLTAEDNIKEFFLPEDFSDFCCAVRNALKMKKTVRITKISNR